MHKNSYNTIIMGKEAQKNGVNKKECVTKKNFCVTHQDNQKTICHKLFWSSKSNLSWSHHVHHDDKRCVSWNSNTTICSVWVGKCKNWMGRGCSVTIFIQMGYVGTPGYFWITGYSKITENNRLLVIPPQKTVQSASVSWGPALRALIFFWGLFVKKGERRENPWTELNRAATKPHKTS